MDTLLHLANLVLHIDKFLGEFIHVYGAWVYAVLFLIVFCETGLVVLPFLPGDSLLFIGGAFCASGQMNLGLLILLLFVAATTGNTVNYMIGRAIGPKVSIRVFQCSSVFSTGARCRKHMTSTRGMAARPSCLRVSFRLCGRLRRSSRVLRR